MWELPCTVWQYRVLFDFVRRKVVKFCPWYLFRDKSTRVLFCWSSQHFTNQDGAIPLQLSMIIGHYGDVIMGAIASQITSPSIVYSTVYSDADHRKHQSSVSPAICAGNSPGTGEFPAQLENVSITSSCDFVAQGSVSLYVGSFLGAPLF